MSKPEWCIKSSCPYYGGGECVLEEWIKRGWYSRKSRNEQYARHKNLADSDLEELTRKCGRALYSKK